MIAFCYTIPARARCARLNVANGQVIGQPESRMSETLRLNRQGLVSFSPLGEYGQLTG